MDNETIKEIAGASSEVAKTTSKALDVTSAVGSFIYKVIGEPIELLSGTYVTDPLRELKKRRLHLLAEKTEALLAKQESNSLRTVELPIAIPILESASIETNEELHDLWATLLSEAMIEEAPNVDRRFVSALREFTPRSAELLRYVYTYRNIGRNFMGSGEVIEHYRGQHVWREFEYSELSRVGFERDEVDHLIQLGILEHPLVKATDNVAFNSRQREVYSVMSEQLVRQYDEVTFSGFGKKLCVCLMTASAEPPKDERA